MTRVNPLAAKHFYILLSNYLSFFWLTSITWALYCYRGRWWSSSVGCFHQQSFILGNLIFKLYYWLSLGTMSTCAPSRLVHSTLAILYCLFSRSFHYTKLRFCFYQLAFMNGARDPLGADKVNPKKKKKIQKRPAGATTVNIGLPRPKHLTNDKNRKWKTLNKHLCQPAYRLVGNVTRNFCWISQFWRLQKVFHFY